MIREGERWALQKHDARTKHYSRITIRSAITRAGRLTHPFKVRRTRGPVEDFGIAKHADLATANRIGKSVCKKPDPCGFLLVKQSRSDQISKCTGVRKCRFK